MNNRNERKLLVETGRELLEKNIVARTWGNTSCRVDDEHCLITPSGLDYMQTTEEDIASTIKLIGFTADKLTEKTA